MKYSIKTPRLVLRTLELADISEKYINWLNDVEVSRYLETRFEIQTRESCENYIRSMSKDSTNYLFGIFDIKTKSHIGNIKLGFVNSRHKVGQLSLFIGEKSYWRNGYGTESIIGITHWAFEFLSLKRIEAGCYESNFGSLRAFLKAGYVVEGFRRSSVELGGERFGTFLLGAVETDVLKASNE